jgi:hypothetical protein
MSEIHAEANREPDVETGASDQMHPGNDPDGPRSAAAPPTDPGDVGIRDTLKDIGSRVPQYAQLSQRLVAEGLMSAGQQGQLLGPLGLTPISRVTRFVPVLNQISRILSMIGAIRFVLTQMNPEAADLHMAAVGLSREQVEADFRVTKDLTRRASEVGAQEASRVLHDGARIAGRLTGKGLRAFRNWQGSRTPPSDSDTRR